MFRLNVVDYIPNVVVNQMEKSLTVHSKFWVYGTKASEELGSHFIKNIQHQWGAQEWNVVYQGQPFVLKFETEFVYAPTITRQEIERNTDLRNVYVRVEEKNLLNISFADGRKSNSGFFILHNVLQDESTTIAHEYGHMLGLWPETLTAHPGDLDQRGKGMPGIMYPRGTKVDPEFQYDPLAEAGSNGGTLDPKHRKVNFRDIEVLMTQIETHEDGSASFGKLTNKYHDYISLEL